jgi:hypothetical protein
MPVTPFRFLAGVMLAAASMVALANSPATWPVSPSRLTFETPYGNLHVATSEYIYESRLQIDGADITPEVRGILNITYAFSLPKAQVALVSVSTGNNICPVAYRWVTLKESGYTVSSEFGSCSEQIQVSARGRIFTMRTPNSQKPDKIDIYTYDGKTIKRRIAAQP